MTDEKVYSPMETPTLLAEAVIVKQKNMDFPEAMQAVIDGGHVTKIEWADEEIYIFLDDYLYISQEGKTNTLIISLGDMIGTDWVCI